MDRPAAAHLPLPSLQSRAATRGQARRVAAVEKSFLPKATFNCVGGGRKAQGHLVLMYSSASITHIYSNISSCGRAKRPMAATAPSPLPPRRRLPRGGEAKPKLGAVPRGAGLSRDAAVAVAQARVIGPSVLLVTQAGHRQAAVVRVGVPLLSPAREYVCGAPPPSAQLAHLVVR